MSLPRETRRKARWLGQFALYLVLFALLVSAGVYLFSDDAPAPQPAPATPAGFTGHEAAR